MVALLAGWLIGWLISGLFAVRLFWFGVVRLIWFSAVVLFCLVWFGYLVWCGSVGLV